ncbi:MAG: hypothetical protein FJ303_16570 [Planctomycetes bacterium]|nr:hypothetical protein [Planctomycetota bacterium]
MSIAIASEPLNASPTWRQFQYACLCVVIVLAVGCAIYAVETLILGCEHRFVENPADTMTRAIGLAHFSIGWLFLFTSPRLRNSASLARLAFWTLFGIGFCWIFATNGADKNPLLMMAFYSFFFIHEVCDEAWLYQQSGESCDEPARAEQFLPSLCWTMSLGLMATLAGFQIVRGHLWGRSQLLQSSSTVWLLSAWALLTILAVIALCYMLRQIHTLYGSVNEMIAHYRPLLAVYAGISTILLVGSMFGSVGANLVILVHGLTWLVCTHRNLSERNDPIEGWWSWLRKSPTGFLTLHVVVIGLALVLFALRTHLWERTGFVCDLVSKTWFPYWSIMHIAMAFWRSK